MCIRDRSNRVPNALAGDGHCNDEMNTAECNFDGGDCCGPCAAIIVTLDNNALVAQGSREGIYHNSSIVNGKASWTSTSQAIWYVQEFAKWAIGPIESIGTKNRGISSDRVTFQYPFDLPSEKWNYLYNNGWTSAEANEIKVDCLKGIFPKYNDFHILYSINGFNHSVAMAVILQHNIS